MDPGLAGRASAPSSGSPLPAARARLHLGGFCAWWGCRGLARRLFGQALRLEPDLVEARLRIGESFARDGRWREASVAFRAAVRRHPTCFEAHGNLVLALSRLGLPRPTLEAVEGLVRARPDEAEPRLLAGALLRRAHRSRQAIEAFRSAVRVPSAPPSLEFTLGEAVLGASEWGRLMAWYRAARSPEPQAARPVPAGWSALNGHPGRGPTSRPATARARRPSRARAGRPRPAALTLALRRSAWWLAVLFGGREPHRVLSLVRGRPLPSLASRTLALALGLTLLPALARAETREARAEARRCLELTREAAVTACQAALDLGITHDRSVPVLRVLATNLSTLGRYDEMVEAYRELVRLRPEDPDARLRLALALARGQNQPEAALVELNRAAGIAPRDPRIPVAMGAALNALGRYDEAVAAFERALALDPEALDERPASRAILEASRRRQRWP